MDSLKLTFHITDRCNLRCKYCYEQKGNKIININYAYGLIDELFIFLKNPSESFLYDYLVLTENTIITLDFIGGEVTLYPEIIKNIIDYFLAKSNSLGYAKIANNLQIIIESNGTTYFNPKVQELLTNYKNIIFGISTDGCQECHDLNRCFDNGSGSFNVVDKALRDYISRYKIPQTKLTFTTNNFCYMLDSYKYLASLGFEIPLSGADCTLEFSKKDSLNYYNALCETIDWALENKIKIMPYIIKKSYTKNSLKGSCGMNGKYLTIDADGNLYNCFRLALDSLGDKARPIGNIITKWVDLNFVEEFNSHIKAGFEQSLICKNCPIQSGCEHCPAENLKHNNNIYKIWRNCGATIAEAKAQKYLIEKAKQIEYPYFEELLNNLINEYDENYEYLINKK